MTLASRCLLAMIVSGACLALSDKPAGARLSADWQQSKLTAEALKFSAKLAPKWKGWIPEATPAYDQTEPSFQATNVVGMLTTAPRIMAAILAGFVAFENATVRSDLASYFTKPNHYETYNSFATVLSNVSTPFRHDECP